MMPRCFVWQRVDVLSAIFLICLGLASCAKDSLIVTHQIENENGFLNGKVSRTPNSGLTGDSLNIVADRALENWIVVHLKTLMESEGRTLLTDDIQAFNFTRGNRVGTLVLLPFGERLLSFVKYKDDTYYMLSQLDSEMNFQLIEDSRGRGKLLNELKSYEAYSLLETDVENRGRSMDEGKTIFLKNESGGEILYFGFSNSDTTSSAVENQVRASDQQFTAGGIISTTDRALAVSSDLFLRSTTTAVSSADIFDPGTGGSFNVMGLSFAFGDAEYNAVAFWSTHNTSSNHSEAPVRVEGFLEPINYIPIGYFDLDCIMNGTHFVGCTAPGYQVTNPVQSVTYGGRATGSHRGTHPDGTVKTATSGPSTKLIKWDPDV